MQLTDRPALPFRALLLATAAFGFACSKIDVTLSMSLESGVEWGFSAFGSGSLEGSEEDASGTLSASSEKAEFEIELRGISLKEQEQGQMMVHVTHETGSVEELSDFRVYSVSCDDGTPRIELEANRMTIELDGVSEDLVPSAGCVDSTSGGTGSCTRSDGTECTALLEGDVTSFEARCNDQGNTFRRSGCSISHVVSCEADTTSNGLPNRVVFYWTQESCNRIDPVQTCESLGGDRTGQCR